MNKGLRLLFCKKCNRKRFCKRIPIPNYNFRYTCSKGHSWEIEGITVERISAMWADIALPKIKDLFERQNAFYEAIRKK